jgi:hypothetical protein
MSFTDLWNMEHNLRKNKKVSKAIPITGRGGLQGCEMLRISQLTDGSKAVSLTNRLHFTLQKHYSSVSGTHFC